MRHRRIVHKDPSLEPELGKLTAQMLATMSDRGPDSAGFAVYGAGKAGETKLTLRALARTPQARLRRASSRSSQGATATTHDTHIVLALPDESVTALLDWVAREAPGLEVVGRGRRIEVYKEVGSPGRWPSASALPPCKAPTPSGTPAWRRNRL